MHLVDELHPNVVTIEEFTPRFRHELKEAGLDSRLRGYRDAGEAAATGGPFPPPITIDHILADERLGVVEYQVEPLPGSDHRAIFAELALPGRHLHDGGRRGIRAVGRRL